MVFEPGKTASELYDIAARLQKTCGEEMQIFIKLLLAAADYQIFADIMMSGPEKQSYFFYIIDGWKMHMENAEGGAKK